MKLLLDTHALLWWLADAPLAEPAREAIASPAPGLPYGPVRDQAGHGTPGLGDDDLLTGGGPLQELGQMRLGLVGVHLHGLSLVQSYGSAVDHGGAGRGQ